VLLVLDRTRVLGDSGRARHGCNAPVASRGSPREGGLWGLPYAVCAFWSFCVVFCPPFSCALGVWFGLLSGSLLESAFQGPFVLPLPDHSGPTHYDITYDPFLHLASCTDVAPVSIPSPVTFCVLFLTLYFSLSKFIPLLLGIMRLPPHTPLLPVVPTHPPRLQAMSSGARDIRRMGLAPARPRA